MKHLHPGSNSVDAGAAHVYNNGTTNAISTTLRVVQCVVHHSWRARNCNPGVTLLSEVGPAGPVIIGFC